jgi:hypothetical protein
MKASALSQIIVAHTTATAVFLTALCTYTLSDIDRRGVSMAPSKPPPNLSLPGCATEHHSSMGIRREMLPETRVHHPNAQGCIPWVAYTATSTEVIQGGRKDWHHEHMDSGHEHQQGAGSAHKCHGAFRRTDCEHGQTTIRAGADPA